MTKLEYEEKKKMISTSDAPAYIKDEAMEDLESKYSSNSSVDRARQQFAESAPDPIGSID